MQLVSQSLATTLVLAVAAPVAAQMSGTYSIDPSGTGPRNFSTFSAAATALDTNGVNGPVVLQAVPGTFSESWTIPAVTGASPQNTITFRGVGGRGTYLTKLIGGSTHIVTVDDMAHDIILDGLDFDSTTSGIAIDAGGHTVPQANIEIKNCHFGSGILGVANTNGSHIHIGAFQTRTGYWSIHDCEFDMPGYNAGLWVGAPKSSICRNHFRLSGTQFAIHVTSTNPETVIANNLFTGRTSSSLAAGVIDAIRVGNDICFNTFDVWTNGAAIRTADNWVYGNVFALRGGGWALWILFGNGWHSDGNLFHVQSTRIGRFGNSIYTSLAAWRAGTQGSTYGSQDLNSVAGDPRFKSATDRRLTANSPGLGNAVMFAGRFDPVTDWDGLIRGSKQDTGAYELTGYQLYGTGCPGTGNKIPTIAIGGDVAPGSQASLDLAGASANATTALSVGTPQASITWSPGCNLLHTPILLIILQTDASGSLSVPALIPASTPITGLSAFVQFGVQDGGASGGVAFTRGAEVRL